MKTVRPRLWSFLLPAVALLATMWPTLGLAAEPPASESMQFLPVEAIRPGLEGVGRSVFDGNEPEEFRVEFIGVLKSAIGPQQDMILARLHGEKVEFTGVISGMSGSPVYVDGKLVGAIAYRIGQFAKEPIAGITPIADMLKLTEDGRYAGTQGSERADLLGDFLNAVEDPGEDFIASGAEPAGTPGFGATALSGNSMFQRIGTPLVCSGCDPDVLAYYAPIFETRGLEPTTGGGMGVNDVTLPLLPGTAIGAALATGDLMIAGIGTVTYIDGDRVFGFGHPFMGSGPLEVPMTQAEVLMTFPSASSSFRVANATEPIGTLVEDRLTAIVGEVGRVPPTLPFKVRVKSPAVDREFNYNVVRDRSWSPVMVALATGNSLTKTTEYGPGVSLALRYRIDLDGFPSVEVEDLYSGTTPARPVHLTLANEAGGLLNFLYNNPFQDLPVTGVEAEVEVLAESQIARISSLRASQTEVRPGEPFTVSAVLSPFRGEDRVIEFPVSLPEDTDKGEVQIVVGSGPTIDTLDRAVRRKQIQQAGNLDDLIGLLSRQRKSRTLYLRVTRRAPSAIVRSEVLPDLPLSVFTVFNDRRLSGDATVMIQATIMEMPKDLDVVTVGGRRITVKVR